MAGVAGLWLSSLAVREGGSSLATTEQPYRREFNWRDEVGGAYKERRYAREICSDMSEEGLRLAHWNVEGERALENERGVKGR